MLPPFITSDCVAELIGFPDSYAFLRHRARLEREHLFPLPMPTSRRPMRWKRDEICAWVERQGKPCPIELPSDPLAAAVASGKVALIELARSA